MLDEPDTLGPALVQRYGHLLPDSLIHSAVAAAPASHVAQDDVAALADAVRRAPEPTLLARRAGGLPPSIELP